MLEGFVICPPNLDLQFGPLLRLERFAGGRSYLSRQRFLAVFSPLQSSCLCIFYIYIVT